MYYLAIISDIYISYLCLRHLFFACCELSLMPASNSKRQNGIHFLQEYMTLLREMNTRTENNIHLPLCSTFLTEYLFMWHIMGIIMIDHIPRCIQKCYHNFSNTCKHNLEEGQLCLSVCQCFPCRLTHQINLNLISLTRQQTVLRRFQCPFGNSLAQSQNALI